MGNEVYANGMEVSCKAASGKSICAFPDVCMTPPQTPATPPGVPIPYPNTGVSSDTTSGSKKVKISDKEVNLKNKSHFKKSSGDEAGSAPKKGVVSSKNRGKVYFNSWSMDVKIEGENAVRHLDMTTHNHGSSVTNTGPWPYLDDMSMPDLPEECEGAKEDMQEKCKDATLETTRTSNPTTGRTTTSHSVTNCTPDCKAAQKCILRPKSEDKQFCCAPDNTGHHMIEDHWIKSNDNFDWYRTNRPGGDGSIALTEAQRQAGMRTVEDAPCVCVNEERSEGDHLEMHCVQGVYEESFMPASGSRPAGPRHVPGHESHGWTYGEGKKSAINAHDATFGDSVCPQPCIEAQLDQFYDTDDETPMNPPHRKQPIGPDNRVTTLDSWSPSLEAP